MLALLKRRQQLIATIALVIVLFVLWYWIDDAAMATYLSRNFG